MSSGLRAQVFVPLQIGCGGSDAGDIEASVAVEVADGAPCAGHAAVVKKALGPMLAVEAIEVDAGSFTTIAGDDDVFAIRIQIGGEQCVGVD